MNQNYGAALGDDCKNATFLGSQSQFCLLCYIADRVAGSNDGSTPACIQIRPRKVGQKRKMEVQVVFLLCAG